MNIVILESDIKFLAKLERFFSLYNLKVYAIYEASQLSTIQGIHEAILITSSFDKEIFSQVGTYIFFSLKKNCQKVKLALKLTKKLFQKKLEFLKVVKTFEIFFLENGFQPFRVSKFKRQPLTTESIKHAPQKNNILSHFFTQLPKSLYALFIKLYKTKEGISKLELQNILFANGVRTSNLLHVQMYNLRKALNRITNDSFKIIYKDKKYKLITEKPSMKINF